MGNKASDSELVKKKEYGLHILKDTVKGLFNSSVNQMVSCCVKGKNVSINELEEIRQMIEEEIREQKK